MNDDACPPREIDEAHIRVVRTGHGANCSSIGSVIDTLFATATVGAAVFVGVLAALRREEVRVVGGTTPATPEAPASGAGSSASADPGAAAPRPPETTS